MAKKVDTPKANTKENLPAVQGAGTELIASKNSRTEMARFMDASNPLFAGVEKSVQGDDKEIFSNDIIIPKVWLTQQMSDEFKEGKAKLGDFIASVSKDILAPKGTKLPFIVLSMFKRWHTFEVIQEKGKVKKQFMSSVVMTTENKNWKYQETVDGKDIVRRQVISAYIVLVDDVKKGYKTPYVIDFASSSKGAGRALVTEVATLENANLPSWVGWFNLDAHEESNDDGDFLVKDVDFGGYLNMENTKLMEFVRECYDYIIIHKDQITIDDSDVNEGRTIEQLDEKDAMNRADRVASAKI